ncbi:hypothetical protein SASPL_128917 [Salvia splendens]|uniref:Leucine-rich PPR motif-containing protein, mitochondrial n=1 Tax=Salvia splendens TaxID=180675 RepID=A0A8X8ZMZ9_SALSN|nr:hypothetical protein SASPL_128917 [Salvia splendens]
MFLHTLAHPNFQSRIASTISRQKWSELKPIIQSSTPADFLRQLFQFDNFDTDLVVSFFKWSQKRCEAAFSIEDHVRLFILLANEKKYPKLRSLLHTFPKQAETFSISTVCHSLLTVSDKACANIVVFDMLISALVSNGKVDLAFEGFMRVGDYGFKLSVRSCNLLLAALVKDGRTGNVEFAYKEMVRRRIGMDVITFNTVVCGLCKAGKLNKARDVVEDMSIHGVAPNVVTYNTLIDGYCKRGGEGRMYKADALLKNMVEKGISPSVITIIKEMKDQGVRPSVLTYNSLINGLCGDGKVDAALSLRDEMVAVDVEPNIVTHSTLINGYSKNNMLKKARDLFDNIISQGVALNVLTFNALINAYCRVGELEEAVAIFNLMLDNKVSPNVSTYNCLVGACCRDGDMEAGHKLLSEMEKGLKYDVVTYNIRIDAMCKRGETRKAVSLKAALGVKKRMEKEGKRPNVVTFYVLIKGFSRSGKLEQANRFLNEMLEKGLVPNRITYDLIKEEIMEKGFVPDIDGHLYSDLVAADSP